MDVFRDRACDQFSPFKFNAYITQGGQSMGTPNYVTTSISLYIIRMSRLLSWALETGKFQLFQMPIYTCT